jgi:hypothetical protein
MGGGGTIAQLVRPYGRKSLVISHPPQLQLRHLSRVTSHTSRVTSRANVQSYRVMPQHVPRHDQGTFCQIFGTSLVTSRVACRFTGFALRIESRSRRGNGRRGKGQEGDSGAGPGARSGASVQQALPSVQHAHPPRAASPPIGAASPPIGAARPPIPSRHGCLRLEPCSGV